MTDLYNLSISDGADEWRKQEAEDLSDLVQRRLHYLQVIDVLDFVFKIFGKSTCEKCLVSCTSQNSNELFRSLPSM